MALYLLSLGPTNFPSFTYIPLFEPITKTPKEWSNLNLITFSSLSHFTASTLFFTYYSGFIFPFIKQMHQLPSLCAYALSHFSHIWHFVTLWTVACQTPLSMEFSRQEYWTIEEPFPSPGIFLTQCLLYWTHVSCIARIFFFTIWAINSCYLWLKQVKDTTKNSTLKFPVSEMGWHWFPWKINGHF